MSDEGERVRQDIAQACEVADAHSRAHPPGDGWYDQWERRHADADGYFAGWSGVPMTWTTYQETDFYGTNAVRVVGELEPGKQVVIRYWADRDVEERLTWVDPMIDVPDNAHWKGWVW